MSSPFERVSDELSAGIRGLSRRAQVALYASAGLALRKGYADWVLDAAVTSHMELLEHVLAHALDL